MLHLEQQLTFILELDRLKAVYRKTYVISDDNRFENSAEHSWHIALMASTLHSYCDEMVDLSRVIKMLLIHDVVEIDAGDTFAFAEQSELDGQADKEILAAQRIFGLLPDSQFQEMNNLWLEFEDAETADARYAKSIDRLLPLLQNMQNKGGSWAIHKVHKSQVLARNEYLIKSAPKLWQYACKQIEQAVSNGWLIED